MEAETQKKLRMGVMILAAVLLIIAAIIALKNRAAAPAAPSPVAPTQTATTTPNIGPVTPATPIPAGSIPKDSSDAMLQRTTGDFVARFGTYSTDAENANLKQLLSRMGPHLLAWAQARLTQAPTVAAVFSGVTTHAISIKITAQTATTATLEVGAQRLYHGGTAGDHTTYEIATVAAVKVNSIWLVDAVTWKEYKP